MHVGEEWSAEFQMSNSRVSGHARAGVELAGGRHALIAGSIIADNAQDGASNASGVELGRAARSVVISGNRIGAVQSDLPPGESTACAQRYGVRVQPGAAEYIISANQLGGNVVGAVLDESGMGLVSGNLPISRS